VIASLRGVVQEKGATEVVLDVNGVGYRVAVSVLCAARLPPVGEQALLRVRTVVREDALDLYGFLSRTEEDLFLLLTSVSHVGPKVALGVLSGLEPDELIEAIARGDVVRLTKIHGVGRKTAERVVLELREKVKQLAGELAASGKKKKGARPSVRSDLVSALVNLGYKDVQAEAAAQAAQDGLGEEAAFEALFKEAMRALRQGA
jgi:holliday junction DNA helicase RuvA